MLINQKGVRPSGPTMTSMSAPSTGPKPTNKDEKVDLKKRGPSRPSMTGLGMVELLVPLR